MMAARRWIAVVCFELRYQARRKAFWLFVAIFMLALAGRLFAQMADAVTIPFHAPLVLAHSAAAMTLAVLLTAAAVTGDAATRDLEFRLDAVMHAAPHGRLTSFSGRFIGVFVLVSLLLTLVPVSSLVFPHFQADLVASHLGAVTPVAYLQTWIIVLLPNAFLTTALLFGMATLVRHVLGAWTAALLVAAVSLFSLQVLGPTLRHWTLASLFDPLGRATLRIIEQTSSPLDRQGRLVGLEPSLLMNRACWCLLALVVLVVACRRFHYATTSASRSWTPWRGRLAGREHWPAPAAVDEVRVLGPLPDVTRRFDRVAQARQTLAIVRDSLRELVTGWTWLLVPGLIVLILMVPQMLGEFGIPLVPTTDRVLAAFRGPVNDLRILLALLAGELVWRERDARIQGLMDTAPVADGARWLGKLLALWIVSVALHVVLLIAGLLIQLPRGVTELEPGVYLRILFGLDLARTLTFGLLALSVHTLVNHKHIGHLLVLLLVLGSNGLAAQFGVEHPLLVYGSGPAWQYSRIRGLDPFVGPVLVCLTYWAAWTLLLAIVSQLFTVRGVVHGGRERLQVARRRFNRRTAACVTATVAAIVIPGGLIFYDTNVVRAYSSSDRLAAWRAEYERRYKANEDVPQPTTVAAALDVELYPERHEAEVRGVYTLENHSSAALRVLHVSTSDQVHTEAVSFDRSVRLVSSDEAFGHRVYALDAPLAPGAAMRMRWSVRRPSQGFAARGINTTVVRNGSMIAMYEWAPHLGYRWHRELTDAAERARHALPPRAALAPLNEANARRRDTGQERLYLTACIGTPADQVAVAPGTLRRSWAEGRRRYAEYVTNAPIGPGYAIFSAEYVVRSERLGDTALEVAYHPRHSANVDRMMHGMRAALAQYERRFGMYPYEVLRMVEHPGTTGTLHSAAATIWYQELFSLLDPAADPRGIDAPFAIVAHEVAHQFQPRLAPVEGRGLVSESFAWYAAFGVIEDTYGPAHLQRFLRMLRLSYDAPRSRAGLPLLRAVDWFDSYRRGALALYALQEYIGRDQIDAAWRRLLGHDAGASRLVTSLDFYRELQALTPAPLQGLLRDLFERNTFWDFETRATTISPRPGGGWRVTLDIHGRKTAVDEHGREAEVAMDDPIEIGVLGVPAPGEGRGPTIALGKHRLHPGVQRVTIDTPTRPTQVAVDPRGLLTQPRR
jgi:ABC-2 type transport system permease protein